MESGVSCYSKYFDDSLALRLAIVALWATCLDLLEPKFSKILTFTISRQKFSEGIFGLTFLF